MTIRKLALVCALFIPAAAAGCGCGGDGNGDEKHDFTLISDGSGDKIALKMNFEPGRTRKVRFRQSVAQGAATAAMTMDLSIEMTQRVVGAEGEGNRVEISYDRITAAIEAQGAHFSYDSRGGATPSDPISEMFACMVDKKVSFLVTTAMEIRDVRGFDEIKEAAKRIAAKYKIPEQEAAAINEDMPAQMFGQNWGWLPSQPVGVGAVWERKFRVPLASLGTLDFRIKSALAKVEAGAARVNQELFADTGNKLNMPNGIEVSIESFSGTGMVEFDVAAGEMRSGEQKINMTMTASPPGRGDLKQTMNLRIEQEMKVEK